jgi:hypothetical protein
MHFFKVLSASKQLCWTPHTDLGISAGGCSPVSWGLVVSTQTDLLFLLSILVAFIHPHMNA